MKMQLEGIRNKLLVFSVAFSRPLSAMAYMCISQLTLNNEGNIPVFLGVCTAGPILKPTICICHCILLSVRYKL